MAWHPAKAAGMKKKYWVSICGDTWVVATLAWEWESAYSVGFPFFFPLTFVVVFFTPSVMKSSVELRSSCISAVVAGSKKGIDSLWILFWSYGSRWLRFCNKRCIMSLAFLLIWYWSQRAIEGDPMCAIVLFWSGGTTLTIAPTMHLKWATKPLCTLHPPTSVGMGTTQAKPDGIIMLILNDCGVNLEEVEWRKKTEILWDQNLR